MGTLTENGFNLLSIDQTMPDKVFCISNDFVPNGSNLLNSKQLRLISKHAKIHWPEEEKHLKSK